MSDLDSNQNRRSFLKYLLSTSVVGFLASVLYPIVSYLNPPKQNEVEVSSVLAGKISDFEKDSGKIIRFGNKPVLVIRTEKDEFKAMSAVCTHLDCTVQYKKEMGLIWCACHNGKYDLNGKNVSGPPPRPLDMYQVNKQGDNIFVSKKA
ncbi:MAG: ubiquinol-cytochrome c reductase iron-sulfur subunit [Ignavibacteria bacterium]|nr:ubiquinol-cytochrome c reductase iron-sulfur subunit [Ignavibacteria bacterium]